MHLLLIMVRPLAKFAFLVALGLLVQGCVGFVFLKPHTEVINNPAVAPYGDEPDDITKRDSNEATNGVVYTSQWLQENWGAPKHIRHASGDSNQVWTYKFDRIWAGPIPLVIVPIPLVLPVARAKVSFTLREGEVVSASTTRPWVVGWAAGVIPNPEGGGKFSASFMNDEAQKRAQKTRLKIVQEPIADRHGLAMGR